MVENPPDNTEEAGNWGSVPGSGRSPGIGDSNPLQYSCLENPLDGGAWSMRSILSMRSQSRRQQHTHTHIDLFRYSPPTNILIDVKELFPCYSGYSQRGQATCMRSHSVWLVEPRLSRNLLQLMGTSLLPSAAASPTRLLPGLDLNCVAQSVCCQSLYE